MGGPTVLTYGRYDLESFATHRLRHLHGDPSSRRPVLADRQDGSHGLRVRHAISRREDRPHVKNLELRGCVPAARLVGPAASHTPRSIQRLAFLIARLAAQPSGAHGHIARAQRPACTLSLGSRPVCSCYAIALLGRKADAKHRSGLGCIVPVLTHGGARRPGGRSERCR